VVGVVPAVNPRKLNMKAAIATKKIADDLSGVAIEFSSGERLAANLADLTAEIITQLALHGLSQKLGDSYAGEKDVSVAKVKAGKVLERLVAGDWRAVREGGGGGRITDLAQALADITGRTIEEAVSRIEDMDKDEKSALRKHKKIKARLAEIAYERAKAAVESGEDDEDLPISM